MPNSPRKTRAVAPAGPLPRVAIVVSLYTRAVTDALLVGARTEYASRGGEVSEISVYEASGAFETVAIALAAAKSKKFDAVVALACIIKGETSHDQVLGHAVTQGLVNVTLQTGVPVGLGVLTVDTPEQAQARAGGTHGNKGQEAMAAALDTALQIRTIRATSTRTRLAPTHRLTRTLPDKSRRGAKN